MAPSRKTRNGKTQSLFSKKISFDLSKGFPLLTTKKMAWKTIVKELLFFISGKTDTKILERENVNIWKHNTSLEFLKHRKLPYREGDMGPMYGFNWRHFGTRYIGGAHSYHNFGYDQLSNVIDLIKTDPMSRRIMMTTFDPSTIDESVLAPCHGIVTQFYIDNENNLNATMYQRSADVFLGLPFNIASYALLMHMIAHVCKPYKLKPKMLNIEIGDAHLYENHIDQACRQLSRKPYHLPRFLINRDVEDIDQFKVDDFTVVDYKSYSRIKAPMS
jgi:thymidylate synthase